MKKIYALIILSMAFVGATLPAAAQNFYLSSTTTEFGVHPAGSFGTNAVPPGPGACPTWHNNAGPGLGLVSNVCGTGCGDWAGNTGGDYTTPGAPSENFAIHYNGQDYCNYGLGFITDVTAQGNFVCGGGTIGNVVTWAGQALGGPGERLDVIQRATTQDGWNRVQVTISLINNGTVPINNLYYQRALDPDNDQPCCGTFTTTNTVILQGGNTAAVRAVGAGAQQNILTLAAQVPGHGVRAGTWGFTNCQPRDPWGPANGGLAGHPQAPGFAVTQDQGMGISIRYEDGTGNPATLNPGEVFCFTFYYIMGRVGCASETDCNNPVPVIAPSGPFILTVPQNEQVFCQTDLPQTLDVEFQTCNFAPGAKNFAIEMSNDGFATFTNLANFTTTSCCVAPTVSTTIPVGTASGSYEVRVRELFSGISGETNCIPFTIVDSPPPPDPIANQTICQGNTATITANLTPPIPAADFVWFDAPAPGGAQLFVGNPFTTPALAANTTYYVSARVVEPVSGTTCESTRVPATVLVDIPAVAAAGPDQTICATNTNVSGNAPTLGGGLWTGPPGVTFGAATSPTTSVNNLPLGNTTLTWTLDNGPNCPSSSDNLVINRLQSVVPPTANNDGDVCAVGVGVLQGNNPTPAGNPVAYTGTWSCTGGPCAGATIATPNAINSNVTYTQNGTYTFTRTHTSPAPCNDNLTATTTVRVFDRETTPVVTAPATACISGGSVTVNISSNNPNPPGNPLNNYTGIWFCTSGNCGGNVTFGNQFADATTVTITTTGTYTFQRLHLSGAPCNTSQFANFTIDVAETATQPAITFTTPLCLNGANVTTALTSNDPTPAGNPIIHNGVWECVSGSGPGTCADVAFSAPNANNTNVTFTAGGTYTLQRRHISNAPCAAPDKIEQFQITVSEPAAAPNASAAPTLLCAGGSVRLESDPPVNGTGEWTCETCPGTPVPSIISTAEIVDRILNNPGTYTFRKTHTSPAPCPSPAPEDVTVTVELPAEPPVISASATLACTNEAITLTSNDPTAPGALTPSTGVWTCESANCGGAANIANPNANVTTVDFVAAGLYTLRRTHTSPAPCASPAFEEIIIEINAPAPAPTAAASATPVCVGETVTLTGNDPNPAGNISQNTGYWRCVGGPCASVDFGDTTQIDVDALLLAPGIYTFERVHENTASPSCANPASATVSVTVNDGAPVPVITASATTVCENAPVTLTSNPATPGTGEWTCQGGNCGNVAIVSPNADVTDVQFSAAGAYVLRRTHTSPAPCGNPLVAEITIDVDPLTVGGTLAASRTVCPNDDSGLMELTGWTGDIVHWEASEDCAFFTGATTIATTAPNYQSGPLTATTCYRVLVQSGTCAPAYSSTVQITVSDVPAQPVLTQTTSPVCPGQTSAFYEVTNTAGTDYVWTLPAEARPISGQTTNRLEVDWPTLTPPGVYTITVTPYENGCEGVPLNLLVTVSPPAPAQPISILGGPTEVCRGDASEFWVENPDGWAVSWSLIPGGAGLAPAGDTARVNWATAGVGSYTLEVRYSNSCGVSPAQILPLELDEAPAAPGGIQLPALHCEGTQATYAVGAVAGADRYVWSNTCGWTGQSNGPEINLTATSAGPCQISVYAENQCGVTQTSLVVTPATPQAAQPGPVAGPAQLCARGSGNYSVAAVANATGYVWTGLPAEARIVSGQGTREITVDWGAAPSGFYTLEVRAQHECGLSAPRELLVQIVDFPPAAAGVTGPVELCRGQTGVYNTTAVGGVIYDWSARPAGPAVTASGASAVVDFPNAGVYIIEVTPRNACGSGPSAFVSVNVKDRELANAGSDRVVCGPNAILVGQPAGGTWVCQTCAFPASVTGAGNFGIVSGMRPGATNVFRYEISDPECGVNSDLVTITNDLVDPGRVFGSATVCAGQSGVLNLGGFTPGATIVRWERSTDNFQSDADIVNTSATLNYSNITQETQYRAVLRLQGICPEQHSAHATITPRPSAVASAAPALQEVCGETAVVSGSAPVAGGTGTWSYVSGPSLATIATTGTDGQIAGMTAAGDYTFRYTVTNPAPCGPSSIDVVVRRLDDLPEADAGPNQDVCAATASLTGNIPPAGASATWDFVTGPAAAHVNASGEVSNMNVPGVYVFRYTLTNPACGQTASDDITITRFPAVTPAVAGGDKEVCAETVLLQGNQPAVGETGEWSFVSGPSAASVSTQGNLGLATGLREPGDYVFRWTISNGVCPESTAEVTVTRGADAASAGVEQAFIEICGDQTTTLRATVPGGVWKQMQGPVGANVITNGVEGDVTGMTAPGDYVFRYEITTACDQSVADVTVRRAEGVFPPPFAGSNQTICGSPSAVLTGSEPPAGATGFWRFVSGPVPAQVGTFGRFGTVGDMSLPGDYVFEWVIDNGVCGEQSDVVTITRVAAPGVADAGPDQQICGATATLIGNTPAPGVTGQWSFVSGPASANVTQNGSAATAGGMLVPGAYTYRWTLTNAPCAPSSSDVTITVSSPTAAGSLGGGATVCAGAHSGTLSLSGQTGNIVRWEVSTDNFATFSAISNTTPVQNYTNLQQDTWYRAVVESGSCGEAVSNAQKITVLPAAVQADAGADQTICGMSALLSGNKPEAGGSASWKFVSGPLAPSVSASGTIASVSGMTVSGTYVFEYELTSPTCGSSVDVVQIDASAGSVGGAAAGAATHCGGLNSGTLTVSGYRGQVVRWEASTDGFATVQSISAATDQYTYNNLSQTTSFRAVIRDGVCGEATSSVVTVVIAPEVGPVSAGADQTICGTSAGVTGSPAGGAWSIVSGPSGAVVSPSGGGAASVSGLSPGVYTLRYEISSAACGAVFDQTTITVSGGSVAGGVVGSTTVCAGANGGTLSLTGFAGTILQWEYSTDNWLTVNVLNNTTNLQDYQNLNVTTQYRAVVQTGGCEAARSTDATVYVRQPVAAADAGPDIETCQSSVVLTGSAAGEGTATWSLVSGSASLAQSGTNATLSGLTPGTYVLEYAVDNSPCAATSDRVTVTVLGNLAGGTVSSDATVCANANSGTLTLAGYQGAILRWEVSTDNFQTFSAIANTTPNQVYTNLTRTTWYRAVVGQPGCGEQYSLAAAITVNPAPSITAEGRMACGGGEAIASATGGAGGYVYTLNPAVRPPNATGVFTGLPAGVYAISVRDAAGCQATATTTVPVSPDPVTITGAQALNGNFATVSWTPAGGFGVTYQLRYRVAGTSNWLTITGLTSTSFTLGGLQPGADYEVEVRYACLGGAPVSAWSPRAAFATPATRETATEEAAASALTVYPNPNRGSFFADYAAAEAGDLALALYDAKGAAVWSATRTVAAGANALRVDAGELPSGVYLLEARQNGQRQSVKVVIE